MPRPPFNIRNPSWFTLLFEWCALLLSVAIVYLQLASGYSWTLPVFGVVPGPPSAGVMWALSAMFVACLVAVMVAAIPILVSGSTGKRIVGGIPALAVVLMVATLVYSRYN